MNVAVIGGGISGMSAALELQKRGADVVVFEASGRAGGMLQSEKVHIEGHGELTIDRGPDSILSTKHNVLNVLNELGLENQLVSTVARGAKIATRKNGTTELVAIPEGFHLLAPSRLRPLLRSGILSKRAMARVAMEPLVPRGKANADESLASFVRRRFGDELLENLAQPLAAGVYGADPEELSLSAVLPRFVDMEQREGSVIRALRKSAKTQSVRGARYGLFVSFKDGMGALPRAMSDALGNTIRLQTQVTELIKTPRGFNVNGEHFDAVILATTAWISAKLVNSIAPPLATELSNIVHGSGAIVSFVLHKKDLQSNIDYAGFLVPSTLGTPVVACTLSSQKWPHRAPVDLVALRVFLGGHAFPRAAHWDDAILRDHAEHALREYLRFRDDASPLLTRVDRWQRRLPRYLLGHQSRVERITCELEKHPRLALAGNGLFGVGIPDSLHAGRLAADKVLSD